MRAALGLTAEANTSQPAEDGRQSAGRDNEKPMATRRLFEPPDPSRARIATLTGELKAERGERVAAQQALSDAQRIIQQLQTKLAHAEMAAAEARAAEQKARLEAEAKLGHTPQDHTFYSQRRTVQPSRRSGAARLGSARLSRSPSHSR